jgi:hypothetical protein
MSTTITTREIGLPAAPSLSAKAERTIVLIGLVVGLVGGAAIVLRAMAASATLP